MAWRDYFRKIRKAGASVLLTTTLAATLTGAAGWQVGRNYQQSQDEQTMSSLHTENQKLADDLAKKEHHESALAEFLQDLRLHLPANTEVEQLLKAGDGNANKDLGAAGTGSNTASLECCKAETQTLVHLFQKGKTNDDPQVRAIGRWIHLRCSDHLSWR